MFTIMVTFAVSLLLSMVGFGFACGSPRIRPSTALTPPFILWALFCVYSLYTHPGDADDGKSYTPLGTVESVIEYSPGNARYTFDDGRQLNGERHTFGYAIEEGVAVTMLIAKSGGTIRYSYCTERAGCRASSMCEWNMPCWGDSYNQFMRGRKS